MSLKAYRIFLATYKVRDRTGKLNTTERQSIERIEFSDGGIAYDLDGYAGLVAKLLGAVFGFESVGNAKYVGIGLVAFPQTCRHFS